MSRQDLLVRSRLATGDIDTRAAAKLCFQDPTRLQKYVCFSVGCEWRT